MPPLLDRLPWPDMMGTAETLTSEGGYAVCACGRCPVRCGMAVILTLTLTDEVAERLRSKSNASAFAVEAIREKLARDARDERLRDIFEAAGTPTLDDRDQAARFGYDVEVFKAHHPNR